MGRVSDKFGAWGKIRVRWARWMGERTSKVTPAQWKVSIILFFLAGMGLCLWRVFLSIGGTAVEPVQMETHYPIGPQILPPPLEMPYRLPAEAKGDSGLNSEPVGRQKTYKEFQKRTID